MLNKPSSDQEIIKNFDIVQYQPWIDFFAKNNNVQIALDNNLQYPASINLQDTQNPIITLNPKLMKEKLNYTDQEIILDLGHEFGHLKEEQILHSSNKGKQISEDRIKRFQEKGNLAESYHKLENVLRDIRVNNDLISPNNIPVLRDTLYSNYKDKMFNETDYTNLPKHLQFLYTLIREEMVKDQKCEIDPSVRKLINRLKRNGIIFKATQGNLGDRLQNIWEYVEPIYQKLLQEDTTEKSEKNKSEKSEKENKDGEKKGDDKNGDGKNKNEGEQNQNQNGGEKIKDKIKKKLKNLLDKNKKGGEKKDNEKGKDQNKGNNPKGNSNNKPENKGESDSNSENSKNQNPFQQYYDQKPGLKNILEQSLSPEDYEKLKNRLQEIYEEKNRIKSQEELEIENRVKNMGIDPKNKQEFQKIVRQLQEYNNFFKKLQNIKDKNTNNTVMEEIKNLFEKIKSHRAKPKYKAKGPVDIEHGYRLHSGSVASGIAQLKGGNDNPEMFELDIKHEKEQQYVGRFDLTIVADGSGSMDDPREKNIQQKISILLVFEALKKLHDKLEVESYNLKQKIEFNTDGIMFLSSANGVNQFKNESSDFTDKERLNTYSTLDYCSGNDTNDYDALKQIIENLKQKSDEYLQNIKTGKVKKIVVVMSDGGSSDSSEMKKVIKILRNMGVLVYGIGITSSGKPIEELFNSDNKNLGFGQVCSNSQDLAQTLKDLLRFHLEKL